VKQSIHLFGLSPHVAVNPPVHQREQAASEPMALWCDQTVGSRDLSIVGAFDDADFCEAYVLAIANAKGNREAYATCRPE
jgi:hypothetical protein